jgi:hypothetical protein
MTINTTDDLNALLRATTFAEGKKPPTWDGMKIEDPEEDPEEGGYPPFGKFIYVPQCSYLGGTLISLGDDYEKSGEDCLFIQELLRLAKAGKLQVVE